jgi:hypothetical protein
MFTKTWIDELEEDGRRFDEEADRQAKEWDEDIMEKARRWDKVDDND